MHGFRKQYCKQNQSQLKSQKKDSTEREEKAKLKLCPIPTCMSVVKRLDVHLRLSHSMNSVNTFAPITDLSTTSPKKRVKSDTMPHMMYQCQVLLWILIYQYQLLQKQMCI